MIVVLAATPAGARHRRTRLRFHLCSQRTAHDCNRRNRLSERQPNLCYNRGDEEVV